MSAGGFVGGGECAGDVDAFEAELGGGIVDLMAGGLEHAHDLAGREVVVHLPHERGDAGDVGAGEACAAGLQDDVLVAGIEVDGGNVDAGGEEVEVVAAGAEVPDLIVDVSRADGKGGGIGGGIFDAHAEAQAVVAAADGEEDFFGAELGEQAAVGGVEGGGGIVVGVASFGDVDGHDVVLGLVVEHPLQGGGVGGVGDVAGAIVDAKGDDVGVGGDAAIGLAVEGVGSAGGDGGDAGAVAVVVHGVGVVIDKVIAGDDFVAGAKAAAEDWIIVVDAGVEDGDGFAGAGDFRIGRCGDVLVEETGKGAPGEILAAFEGFEGEPFWKIRLICVHSYHISMALDEAAAWPSESRGQVELYLTGRRR